MELERTAAPTCGPAQPGSAPSCPAPPPSPRWPRPRRPRPHHPQPPFPVHPGPSGQCGGPARSPSWARPALAVGAEEGTLPWSRQVGRDRLRGELREGPGRGTLWRLPGNGAVAASRGPRASSGCSARRPCARFRVLSRPLPWAPAPALRCCGWRRPATDTAPPGAPAALPFRGKREAPGRDCRRARTPRAPCGLFAARCRFPGAGASPAALLHRRPSGRVQGSPDAWLGTFQGYRLRNAVTTFWTVLGSVLELWGPVGAPRRPPSLRPGGVESKVPRGVPWCTAVEFSQPAASLHSPGASQRLIF